MWVAGFNVPRVARRAEALVALHKLQGRDEDRLANVAPIELARQSGATDLSYALALADFCSGAIRATSAFPPKYNRYERWIPYITGNTTKAACQPK